MARVRMLQEARPACFTPEQWELWRSAARQAISGFGRPKNFCEDCTPAYQAEMMAANRCQHPGTTYKRDADGFLCGVRPQELREDAAKGQA